MPNQAPTLPREEPTPASAGAEPAIRLRGLRKEFGPVRAVDGLDLDIPAGEFFSMLGPSGSGKTTVLRLIAGFELPTGGTIELDGREVS
ncbi:MAG TPA: ATP-binding cassette domain-containing protein, partial [Pseudonocardia sp.]